jgi:hypothetical protein
MLPTPKAQNAKGNGKKYGKGGQSLDCPIGQKTGLKLQPNFVEWMQGFPIGWTDVSTK